MNDVYINNVIGGLSMNKYTEVAIAYFAYACGKLYNMRFNFQHREYTGSILVLRAEAIGDMVVTTPFLRELRKNYPDRHITLVCSPAVYNLVECCPYVDEILEYQKQFSRHKYIINLKNAFCFSRKYLQKRNYEMALVPAYDSPDAYAEAWLGFFAGIRKRIGYSEKVDEHKHDYYNGAIDIFFTDLLQTNKLLHCVEASLGLLRYLQHSVEDESLEVWTNADDEEFVAELFRLMKIDDRKIKIAVNLSTSNHTKDWPVENYIAVCQNLEKLYPIEIFLIGAGNDAEKYRDVFCKAGIHVCDFVGKTTVRQAIEVLRRSDMYLGGDTGPMHLAAACNLSGVAIYKTAKNVNKNLHDPARTFSPWQSDIRVLQPDKALPGCENGCTLGEAHCIKQITVKQVVDAMEDQMKVHEWFHKNVSVI